MCSVDSRRRSPSLVNAISTESLVQIRILYVDHYLPDNVIKNVWLRFSAFIKMADIFLFFDTFWKRYLINHQPE